LHLAVCILQYFLRLEHYFSLESSFFFRSTPQR